MRLWNAFKYSVFDASTLVSTKTLLLKHYYRRQGRNSKNNFRIKVRSADSASPKPHPSKPHPCNQPQAKTEVALQFSECCAAETALQHRLFCNAEVIWTRGCAAANEKLHCNIEKAALHESGAFLPPAFLRVSSPHV